MTPILDAVGRSWPVDPWLWAGLLVTGVVYLRGWRVLRRRDPERWSASQAIAFVAGLLTLFLALGSPLEPFTSLLLQAHMVQHLLLMMLAPPLLWLGAPLFPLIRGLPGPLRTLLTPIFGDAWLHRLFRWLTHPAAALVVFVVVTWGWHVPAAYELALRSEAWHYVQHACFLGAGLLFWYPVVRPYPARPEWSPWLLIPYLIAADVQNTALSALLAFADEPWYPHYVSVPRLGGQSALEDQAAAAVWMWVPGSLAYLVPLAVVGVRLLYGEKKPVPRTGRIALPMRSAPHSGLDLLTLPLLGRFLRWRHARLALQLPLLLLAVIVIADGLLGPQVAPLNLAGVLPWIHWRGILVIGLFAIGNVFCLACPFLLPRKLARWLMPPRRTWPRILRNKWPAIGLLVVFLWAYEAFALWDRPWWTAWLAIGYFVAAFVIDGLFRHAAFCKYVCPIGQFNFVQSLVSPTEVRVRDPRVCEVCTTKDCIRGSETSPGCELALYLPRKQGNMDCTFCLDCVHACPHDNVALAARSPTEELCHDPQRSGVGKFTQRTDLAVLVVVLVFGAFVNAAGMIAPVVAWQESWGHSPWLAATVFYAGGLCLSLIALLLPSWLSFRGCQSARHFVWSLVPLGAAMWLSHYAFHFFTSYDALIPATQRAAHDLGFLPHAPEWVCHCCVTTPTWILRLELVALDLGLLASLYVAWRIADRRVVPMLPWAILILCLFAVGVWILLEPMQMRGTLQMTG